MPRVTEAVVGCLLRLYNLPGTRLLAGLDLSPVVAPFTELHYVHCGLGKSEESRIESSVTALLSILRSWPGSIFNFHHLKKLIGLKSEYCVLTKVSKISLCFLKMVH